MGRISRLAAVLCCGLLTTVLATVQDAAARVLTLDDCLRLTAGYSRDILIAAEGKNVSYGRYIEERAAALPQLRAEASMVESRDQTALLFGGGELNEARANLNFTQVLFTWGQIGAAIRAAGHDRKATEHQYEAARQLALRETATAFYNLLLALELEKVASDSVEQRRRHLDETERKYQLEVATDFDVLAARVSLTNAQPTLTQAENAIRLTKDRLRYYTGLQEDFEIAGSLNSTPKASYSIDEVIENAKAKRPEVAFYYSRVGAFEELVKVVKGGNKPRVDLRGNLGWSALSGSGFDIPEGERWDVGIFLSFPFFDGLRTKGRVIQAEAQRNTTELEMQKLFDNIALEARQAINRLHEAIEIVRGLEATTVQAERLLVMAEAGYHHGVKTKLEVDDAELNLTTARSNLAQARRDYLLARTLLLWIMGEDLLNAFTSGN